jgi:hypothetical protein
MAVEKVMVTASPDAPPNKAVFVTTPGVKDIQVVVMSWLTQTVVRTLRTYLQTFVGIIAAESSGIADALGVTLIPAHDFGHLLATAGGLSLAPAVIAFLQNAVELLTKLDNPEFRA